MRTPTTRVRAATAVLLGGLVLVPAGAAAAAPQPAAPQPAAQGRLMSYVVNTAQGRVADAQRAVRAVGGTVVQAWPQIGVVVVQSRVVGFRSRLLAAGDRSGVQSVGATRTAAVVSPPDGTIPPGSPSPGLPSEGTAYDVRQVRADLAHQLPGGRGDRSVQVAVLDSGIDDTHPDLAANIDAADSVSCVHGGRPVTGRAAWRPTSSEHGTHVAGTVAAVEDGRGVVGVAPGVRISSVKVVDENGFIYPEYAICGMVWAAEHGADVTNNSYYIDPWSYWCGSDPDQAAASEAVRRAFAYATRRGVLSVAAAGNDSADLAHKTVDLASPDDSSPVRRRLDPSCLSLPTELPGVVTVSATTRGRTLAPFSNYGVGVIDVAAPGQDVWSTTPGGTYGQLSGTSMASPHVAGVAGLLVSRHPGARPSRLLELLRAQAQRPSCATDRTACTGTDGARLGAGIVDALAAVR